MLYSFRAKVVGVQASAKVKKLSENTNFVSNRVESMAVQPRLQTFDPEAIALLFQILKAENPTVKITIEYEV